MNIDQIYEFLKKAILKNRVAHAFIVYGGTEETRKDVALKTAKLLECETSPEICNRCYPCRTITSGNFPDVHSVRPEKRNLSIDEVRTIKEQIYTKPYAGKHRTFIIETDWMQQPAANSLLKIMEEPPAYGILLILTRNNKNFLPTITSRAINIRINPDLELDFDSDSAEKFADIIEKASKRKWYELFETVGETSKSSTREEIENMFDALVLVLRQILLQSKDVKQFGLPSEKYSDIIKTVQHSTIEKILDMRQHLRFNVNTRIFLQTIAAEFIQPKWRNWQTR